MPGSQLSSAPSQVGRQRIGARFWITVLICVLVVAVAWLGTHRGGRIEDLTYTPGGADEDAKDLIDRMLRVNRPWLEPKPVFASYSLHRKRRDFSLAHGLKREQETLGPYSIVPGCKQAVRVGSIVQTPLHAMIGQSTNWTALLLGRAKWRGTKVVAFDVMFDPPVRCAIGMGGQSSAAFSSCSYQVNDVRILMDLDKAVPLVMRTFTLGDPTGDKHETVWEFAPQFAELNDGLAPLGLDWSESDSSFREHQEFHLVSGIWIFARGKAVLPRMPSPSFPGSYLGNLTRRFLTLGHASQELELKALQLQGGNGTGIVLKTRSSIR